jgi:hypothetical protein
VAAIFRDKPKPANEFDAWVCQALDKFQAEKMNADFDIPTFMAFLSDVESPYEVNKARFKYFSHEKSFFDWKHFVI